MGYSQVIDAREAFALNAMNQRPATGKPAPARLMPATALTDPMRDRLAALIARMAVRDERALAEFYDATLSRAYGVTLRIVRNAALAEEVVGDAYHQAWRDAARYDASRSGALTWLLMICRSRALDALRARDPAIAHEDPHALVDDADHPRDDDPLDLLTATASHRAVNDALRVLTPAPRQMIGLAFFRGLSHQEIAGQTATPHGTVKSQIRRALATLRAALDTE